MTKLEQAKEFFKEDIYATQVTGVELIQAEEGYAKCKLKLTNKHLNAAGSIMGGVIFTLADFAFAVAANFEQPLTVTLASQISYLSPVKGKILTAEAKRIKEGNKTSFYLIDIKDELGTDIAAITTNGYRKE